MIHLISRIDAVTATCRRFSPEPVGCDEQRVRNRWATRAPTEQLPGVVAGTADAAAFDPDRLLAIQHTPGVSRDVRPSAPVSI